MKRKDQREVKSEFRLTMDRIARHMEVINSQLQIKPLSWSTLLVGPATSEQLDLLNKRRDRLVDTHAKLVDYADSYASSENEARREVALYMANDYSRYITAIDERMTAIISFLQKQADRTREERLTQQKLDEQQRTESENENDLPF